MGIMTRRNVKARAVVVAAPAVIEKPKKTEEPIEVEEVKEESLTDKVKAKGLSKTDINRMPVANLQALAKEFGIDGAEEMSGNQIKKMLNNALED